MIGGLGLQLANPQILKAVIDGAISSRPRGELAIAAALFIAVALLQQALGVAAAYVGENLAWKATNELRSDLAAHCLSLDMDYHNETSPGELIQRIDSDVAEFSNFFSQLVVRILGNILLMVGIVAVLVATRPAMGAFFALFAALALAGINLVRNIAVEPERLMREADTALTGFLEERLAGTEDIRSSGAVGYVLGGLFALQRTILLRWKKSAQNHILIRLIAGVILMSGFAGAFVAGYILYRRGEMSLGSVFALIAYVNLLTRPIHELSQEVDSLQSIGASVERIGELKSRKPLIVDGSGPPLPERGPLSLSFESVGFSYTEGEAVLDGLDFELHAGEVLGLLGRTGSGKSTIARLVFRLHEPGSGRIVLGGRELAQTRLADLRSRVAMVTQEVQLFQASVRDNIAFFDPAIRDEDILGAIESLGLLPWLEGLSEGLDTRLETGGRSVSAGEGQLLAFTRVFLRDPGLVILDEASSRLDPATEALIETAVDRLLENRTGLVIAHRLGTVERADDILILEEGRALEFGNRRELAADPRSRFSSLLRTGMEEALA
jgi:ABC-type multidrug transport system fused ATPase/permease subunit